MSRGWVRAVLVLGALLVAAAVLGSLVGPPARDRFPSSFSGDPEGTLAFRRLLGELGVPVEVTTRPWDELGPPESYGLLLVATPLRRPVDDREIEALRRWLAQGRALLVVDDATERERSPALDALLEETGLGGRHAGSRPDPRTGRPARPLLAQADPTPALPAARLPAPVELQAGAFLSTDPRAVPLAVSRDGRVTAAAAPLGAGRVVRVMGPLLANDGLLHGGHLEMALALVEDLRGGGPVRVDEFHHGYGGVLPVGSGLQRGALAWAGGQALVAALLYGLARGVRFGPIRRRSERRRRSSLEFTHSMASLYRRAASRGHVVGVMLDRLRQEAQARWGLAPDLDAGELARALAERTGLGREHIETTLRDAESGRAAARLAEADMWRQARALARLQREVLDGDRTRA